MCAMNFELIDYSEDYYTVSLKETVPENRSGKFVQIRHKKSNQEFIVLSLSILTIYHADIVEKFCLSKEIKGRYHRAKNYFMITDTSWEVIGGGHWGINSIKKILVLAGKSQAYGSFDSDGLEANILSLRRMKGYTVNIES